MLYKNKINSLTEIVNRYDIYLVDIWGVIYDGKDPYDGAVAAINSLMQAEKKVVFLSNTPRPSDVTKSKLIEWGVDFAKAMILTSGDAVREQLASRSDDIFKNIGKKFYHLGQERNEDILRDLDARAEDDLENADFILLTLFMDEGEDLDKYDDFFAESAKRNLPVICANPDIVASNGDQLRYCAGYFAKKYEKLGGIVHYYGKPNYKFYAKSLSLVSENIDMKKVLMIGDTMYTDILGANNAGIDSLLLLTGNGKEIANNPHKLEEYSYKPTWIMPRLL